MKHKAQAPRNGRRTVALLATLVALAAIVVGTVLAFNRLRELWLEQCRVADVDAQIEITSGDRVKSDTVRELFGLKNGANLATIDFAAKRDEALRQYPVIKTINISRRLPDGLSIAITERTPFAKLNLCGSRRESGRVCDDEGVVFSCRRGAEMLPVIREAAPGSKPGDRLAGRTRAALAVLRAVHDAEFAQLGVVEVSTGKPDFLLVTLASYKVVKLAWTGMDVPTPASDAAMLAQLRRVAQTIATNLQPETRVWNATQPGVVTADIYGNH